MTTCDDRVDAYHIESPYGDVVVRIAGNEHLLTQREALTLCARIITALTRETTDTSIPPIESLA